MRTELVLGGRTITSRQERTMRPNGPSLVHPATRSLRTSLIPHPRCTPVINSTRGSPSAPMLVLLVYSSDSGDTVGILAQICCKSAYIFSTVDASTPFDLVSWNTHSQSPCKSAGVHM